MLVGIDGPINMNVACGTIAFAPILTYCLSWDASNEAASSLTPPSKVFKNDLIAFDGFMFIFSLLLVLLDIPISYTFSFIIAIAHMRLFARAGDYELFLDGLDF